MHCLLTVTVLHVVVSWRTWRPVVKATARQVQPTDRALPRAPSPPSCLLARPLPAAPAPEPLSPPSPPRSCNSLRLRAPLLRLQPWLAWQLPRPLSLSPRPHPRSTPDPRRPPHQPEPQPQPQPLPQLRPPRNAASSPACLAPPLFQRLLPPSQVCLFWSFLSLTGQSHASKLTEYIENSHKIQGSVVEKCRAFQRIKALPGIGISRDFCFTS